MSDEFLQLRNKGIGNLEIMQKLPLKRRVIWVF